MRKLKLAEPIINLAHKYAEGSDSPAWRKKQINNKTLKLTIQQMDKPDDLLSLSAETSNSEDLPGGNDSESDNNDAASKDPLPKQQVTSDLKIKPEKNIKIQEKLSRVAEKIKIQTSNTIKL